MRNAYIVKKSVNRNPLSPKVIFFFKEYIDWVESEGKLIWSEDTVHGKKWLSQNSNIKLKTRSYLNYNPDDEKSFVQLLPSISGFITVQFDFKSTKENLHDLIDLASRIDCNLWQYSPKRRILTHEIVNNRYKRKTTYKKGKERLKKNCNLDLH